MKKTKPIIRILLGISLIMLISVLNQYFTDVMGTKHIITTCVGGLMQIEWMVLVLAAIIFIADFAGDG